MLQRILVAVVGIPLLLFVLCRCPAWATAILLEALCIIGAHELCAAVMPKEKADSWFGMAAILSIFTLFAAYWQTEESSALALMPWLLAAFVVLLFVTMVIEYGKPRALHFGDVCAILMAGIAIPMAFGCLLRIRLMEYGSGLVLIPLVAAFCSDSMALFAGMAVSKRKESPRRLAPLVSPKKTQAGALGGLAGGVVGMILFRICFFLVTEVQLNVIWCILLGLVGSLMGQLGDLSFSCIKREFGIKDYGRLLPGHGGVLDRFDSVIFAAPILWMIMRSVALY